MTWDISTPQGSESKSNLDSRIREIKIDVRTAFRGNASEGNEAIFPGNSTSSPIFRYRGIKGPTTERPSSGEYGLFFDTTRNALQRDNGTIWEDICTVIPLGTAMAFFQAAAPTGWTKQAVQDAQAFRVVSGTGGGSGGSADPGSAITLAHSHTVDSHTHTISSDGGHDVRFGGVPPNHTTGAGGGSSIGGSTGVGSPFLTYQSTTDGAHTHSNAGSTAPGSDSQLSNFTLAYINVIICTKD